MRFRSIRKIESISENLHLPHEAIKQANVQSDSKPKPKQNEFVLRFKKIAWVLYGVIFLFFLIFFPATREPILIILYLGLGALCIKFWFILVAIFALTAMFLANWLLSSFFSLFF